MALTPMSNGLSRTNPQSNPNNALTLKGITKIGGGTFAPTWTWAVTSAGTTTTFTPTAGYNTSGLRYFKWQIIDEDGNKAYGAATVGSNTAVAVTTSGLDPKKKWTIFFSAEVRASGKSDKVDWQLVFPAGYVLDNPTGSGQNV